MCEGNIFLRSVNSSLNDSDQSGHSENPSPRRITDNMEGGPRIRAILRRREGRAEVASTG